MEPMPHLRVAIASGWLLLAMLGSPGGPLTSSLLAATSQPAAPATVPERGSVTGAGNSSLPIFSPDGRGVAFLSHANNLVTNDDRGPWLDLFWRELGSDRTELVSVSTNGCGGANSDVALAALSADGRFIAFETTANNLTPGDGNFVSDIFVRDLVAGTTRLASVDVTGTRSGNGRSLNPHISADGRYVVFESEASDLVANDLNGTNDVFIRDLVAGTTALVSLDRDGAGSPQGAPTADAWRS